VAQPGSGRRAARSHSLDRFLEIYRASKGVVLVAAHLGNNEAAAAGFAKQGLEINVVGDDSSYRELYELFERQRESWGCQDDRLAQPARRLRRPPTPRRARPAGRLGLSRRRHPGEDVRLLDDAAGRSGDPGRQARLRDRPVLDQPAAQRNLPGGGRRSDPRPLRLPGGPRHRDAEGSPPHSRATSRRRRSSGTTSSRSGRPRPRKRQSWRPGTARRWRTTPKVRPRNGAGRRNGGPERRRSAAESKRPEK
jgi:hypothetical protein